ncbi:MAG: oligosaccharide flippase family protein [Deinococcota bacterium]
MLERLKAFSTKSLGRFVAKGSVTRNITLIASGTIIGQAATLAVLPLLTRLYTPADFGAMAIFLAILVPLNAVASLRYEMAIPLPDSEDDAQHLLILSLVIVVVLSGVLSLLVIFFGEALLTRINGRPLLGYLWLLPLTFLGGGGYHALSHYAIRLQAFRTIAVTKITQGMGQGFTQAILGLAGIGLSGLLIGLVVRFWGGMVALVKLLVRDMQKQVWQPRRSEIKSVAVSYKRFPMFSSGGTFLQMLSMHLPSLLLAAVYSAQVAGWFSLGQRVLEAPINLLAKSAAQVYLGTASKIKRNNPEALRGFYQKMLFRQTALSLPLMLLAMLPAPWLFPWLFGRAWQVAGHYVQSLALMFFLQFLAQTVAVETLTLVDKQDWFLFSEIAKAGCVLTVFILAWYLNLPARVTVLIYGLLMSVIYALYLLFAWQQTGRVIHDEKHPMAS